MSKFESMFRLWMAGFGVTSEQADKICANRRMKCNIERKDSGGVVIDLDCVLFEEQLFGECREMLQAFNTPQEKLFLIMALK